MFRIATLFMTLGAARLGDLRARTKTRILYLGLLAALGLMFLVFVLLAITVALASQVGALGALLIMAGVTAVAGLAVVLMMRQAEQALAIREAKRSALQSRLTQTALLAGTSLLRRVPGGLLGVAAVAGIAVLLAGRGDADGGDE